MNIPAANLLPGDHIRSNSLVRCNQFECTVLAVETRAFDGASLVRVEGVSDLGTVFTSMLVFKVGESVEIVR